MFLMSLGVSIHHHRFYVVFLRVWRFFVNQFVIFCQFYKNFLLDVGGSILGTENIKGLNLSGLWPGSSCSKVSRNKMTSNAFLFGLHFGLHGFRINSTTLQFNVIVRRTAAGLQNIDKSVASTDSLSCIRRYALAFCRPDAVLRRTTLNCLVTSSVRVC